MKYSLVGNITNVSGTSLNLSDDVLMSLTNGNVASTAITISGGDSFYVVCDLENRFSLSALKYYYSGDGTVSVDVAESQDFWHSMSTSDTEWGAEVDFSSFVYYPRWLRLLHTVSVGESDIKEISIYNEDGNILFGQNGSSSSYGLDSSGTYLESVAIYNYSSSVRDINVFIENTQDSTADSFLSYGTTTGTLYRKRERGISMPYNFSWSSGKHEGTEVSGTSLVVSGTLASGTYYSPVMDVGMYSDYRFFWDGLEDGNKSIDYPGIDSQSCFGVRRYNVPPSGTWVSGALAEDFDSRWSISDGILEFTPVPNDTILELRGWDYLQFSVTLTGTAAIYSAGIEAPVVVQGIPSNSYKNIYISSISGTTSGKSTHLMCWYTE